MTSTACPRCRAAVTPGDPWPGLCPACLLEGALGLDDGPCPYQVLAPVDEDPRGITYLAQEARGARRLMALTVYADRNDSTEVLARFQTWKPALEAIRHPGLRALLDVGSTAGGRLYTASEFVGGTAVTIPPPNPPRPDEARLLAWQVADAIAVAHEAGVPHGCLTSRAIRVARADRAQATVVALGRRVILEGGADSLFDDDIVAVRRLVRQLGVDLPDGAYPSAASVRAALR